MVLLKTCTKDADEIANSVDPDQTRKLQINRVLRITFLTIPPSKIKKKMQGQVLNIFLYVHSSKTGRDWLMNQI